MATLPGISTQATGAQLQTIEAESGLVNALYGEQGAAASATGQATAETTIATGDIAEEGDYTQAETIAQNNANIALVGGQVQEYQNMRTVMMTVGGQKADIAGAGFQESGTALSLAQSSMMQGVLQNQIIGTNADLQAGGFLQQAAASKAEAAAAATASAAATDLATTDANQASIDTAAGNADAALLSTISAQGGDLANAIQSGGNVAKVLQTADTTGTAGHTTNYAELQQVI